MTKNKIICITGASTGLGWEMTRALTAEGHMVVATVRKTEDAERLKEAFGENVQILFMDMTKSTDLKEASKELEVWLKGRPLDVLINNAGMVAPGPIMYLPLDSLKHQFHVNVFGLLEWSQLTLPFIQKSDDGKIINISSVSGLITSPFTAAYSSSKFALEALSDGMRRELMNFGVKVIVVQPGPTKTPIWKKNASVAEQFSHTPYAPLLKNAEKIIENTERDAIEPQVVSRKVCQIVNSSNPKTRYIVAKRSWVYWLLSRCMPDRWLDKLLVRDEMTEEMKTRPF